MKLFITVLFTILAGAIVTSHEEGFPPIEDILAFIDSIELAEPRYKSSTNRTTLTGLPPDNKKEGYIVGGGVTAFTENVKGQTKQDILDATLFAQLGADRQYNREKDSENWYKFYINILSNIGFTMKGFSFIEYKSSGGTLVMSEAVIQILAAVATGGQSLIIEATLTALQGMAEDDSRITLFREQSSSYTTGNFQIYSCDQSSNGDVSMSMGAFYFTTSSYHADFLFFGFGSASSHLYNGAEAVVLNAAVYNQVRSSISSKLGNNAVELVASIELN